MVKNKYLRLSIVLSLLLVCPLTLYSQTENQQNTSTGTQYTIQQQQEPTQQTPVEQPVYRKPKRENEWGIFMGPSWSIPVGTVPQVNTQVTYANERARARTGFDIGVKFNFFLSNDVSIEFDVLYTSSGKNIEYSGFYHELGYSDESVTFKESLGYFTFPIYANYYLTENFYIKGGLYGAALTNATRREGGIWGDHTDVSYLYKGGDFGVSAGLGASMRVFFIEWRYNRGLIDISFDDDKLYNQTVQLLVGFKFGG
ncbi:outer membrane beta-barrel protein [Flammeovirga sp. SubArs3]|uniref:outer membrane beta-barrel protein n=1 Tax=Flammeovirga sp. SubArs3 TaxID=2995316 RepID=UPI00248BD50C|nr:outer membrane beta-barrel protein [Flammeovirga sp. SubArs3]